MFNEASKYLEKAGLAWQRGDHRGCADAYRNGYEECMKTYRNNTSSSAKKWELEYCCISGYTSLFREKEVMPTDADFLFLKTVGLYLNSPLASAQAYLTRGLLFWDKGLREKAARQYRRGLESVSGATKEQRLRQEMLPLGGTYKLQVTEPLMNDVAQTLRQNLTILETGKAPANLFANPSSTVSGKVMTYPVQGKLDVSKLEALTSVSGAHCNHCGAMPQSRVTMDTKPEAKTCDSLKMCQRCQRAWYCSKECQLAAWKTHKTECRARYLFAPGEAAILCNLNSQPELNGTIVTILAKDERVMSEDPALQKWQVAPPGAKPIIVAASKLDKCN